MTILIYNNQFSYIYILLGNLFNSNKNNKITNHVSRTVTPTRRRLIKAYKGGQTFSQSNHSLGNFHSMAVSDFFPFYVL